MFSIEILETQKAVCRKYGASFTPTAPDSVAGIATAIGSGATPISGLRHPKTEKTSGWYIWAGEYESTDDFFKPTHVKHLIERSPIVLKYLGLPPGWRFQIDDKGYEDVWKDDSLLSI